MKAASRSGRAGGRAEAPAQGSRPARRGAGEEGPAGARPDPGDGAAGAPRRASIRASAPARANLLGNPSDLYGGAVLSCSVPLRAHARAVPARECVLSCSEGERTVRSAADLELRGDAFDLARAVLRDLGEIPPARLSWETEIPLQSGLAGSTALLAALTGALLAWRGAGVDPIALAECTRRIERRVLGITCGWIDHYMAALGGLRFVDLAGKEHEHAPSARRPARVRDVRAPRGGVLPFVLAFTGVRHHSGAVHAPIRERWERGDPEVRAAYARLRELAFEGLAAFEREDWPRVGALMDENHAIQQALGGSGEVNDRLIEAARAAGALGAKLAGAGHGGTIVALWTDPDPAPLEAALRGAGAAAFYRTVPVPGLTVG